MFPPPESQIVSNAHGSFPQFELFNVQSGPRHLRRYHTLAGHSRPRDRPAEAPAPVSVEAEIIERLGNVSNVRFTLHRRY